MRNSLSNHVSGRKVNSNDLPDDLHPETVGLSGAHHPNRFFGKSCRHFDRRDDSKLPFNWRF